MERVKLLFVSSLCSNNKYEYVRSNRTVESLDPSQRLFGALIRELSKSYDVTCVSAIPLSSSNCNIQEFDSEEENVDGVKYVYPGFRNSKLFRYVDIYKNTKTIVKNWLKTNENAKCVILCDSLVLMCSKVARQLAKRKRILSMAYVTDYPSMATSIKTNRVTLKSFFQRLWDLVADNDIRKYDGYIVVSKRLMELIRPKNERYIVVEDIAEIPRVLLREPTNNKVLTMVYGGALCERFGVNKLVDAIINMENPNVEMLFYGSGESVEYIVSKSKTDRRIKYGGVVSYNELQEIQKRADLLVNPRPTDEIFSAYSFPSKTTSYMVSGTPVLTTRIPGIPNEYFDYLLVIEEEDTFSMSKRFDEVSQIPSKELFKMGSDAFLFLSNNKRSEKQCEKIIAFISSLLK